MIVTGVSMIMLATVILFAIIGLIASRINKRGIHTAGKTLPGPPQWPLLGNSFYFMRKVEDLVEVLTSLFDSYPAIYQTRVGPLMLIIINDPDLSKALDTTTIATNMLTCALASYPDIQKKVYEAVTEVCGNGEEDEQTITVNQLNNLTYLERVIEETLRLFPIVCIIPRDVTEDITIGGYHVPKGAVINVTLFALHKNKKFWPDPLKFDPDRFLPEEVEKRHPYAYMPFGTGLRNCIGSKYAMMSMKMICAKVVQKFALEKDHTKNIADTKMKIGITMKACDPVTIRIRKRQTNIAKA